MDLTFQVSYAILFFTASDLLSPPDTSTTEHHFCFGPVTSFFPELLEIALSSSPVAHWTPSDLGVGAHCLVSYLLPFHTVHGVLMPGILEWFAVPSQWTMFLSDVSTKTCSSWVALHGMAHDFTELCKPLCHDKAMIHEGVDHQGSPLTS